MVRSIVSSESREGEGSKQGAKESQPNELSPLDKALLARVERIESSLSTDRLSKLNELVQGKDVELVDQLAEVKRSWQSLAKRMEDIEKLMKDKPDAKVSEELAKFKEEEANRVAEVVRNLEEEANRVAEVV